TVDDARKRVMAAVDPADIDTLDQVSDAFDQIAQAQGSADVHAALRQFRAVSDDVVGPGVHLLNAHTGKGQQFDWVVVCGLEDGHVPDFRCQTAAELAEEQRVLLVMLSRARLGLIAKRSDARKGGYGAAAP